MSRGKNLLLQDIYKDRNDLNFTTAQESYREFMVAFPSALAELTIQEELKQTTLFQIVDMIDVTKSIVSSIETLQFIVDANESYQDKQRGNGKQVPRRAVQNVETDNGNNDGLVNDSYAPTGNNLYKFTLQDCYGNLCYAYEKEPLHLRNKNDIFFPVKLGSKIIVYKKTKIMFNTLHLTNHNIKYLAGSIDRLRYNAEQRILKGLKEEINYQG
ncbi:hypothetical protein C6P40_003400 [Pichia californica]|uniref:RecQ mediated genome instability protein 1 OB-fold domain-containing protein n=1 Tax=Pichia californica TaxID=460514 RepID=A0A9P7BDE2_9ASCO|nr:hypothetical protein C6P42_003695 [[Candida] californica]KAG0686776.1 hypothetical protein C6P40_003400 [[Candida] californica]